MRKRKGIIISLILIGMILLAGAKVYIGPKITLMKIEESLKNIPFKLEEMNLKLTGMSNDEYPTQQQMLRKGKKAIASFTHTVECSRRCTEVHRENYEIKTDFKRLDKRVEIVGQMYIFPYIFSLHNKKEEENYNLYYEMNIPIVTNEAHLAELQKAIDRVEGAWGVETRQTIRIKGLIEGQVGEALQEKYTKEIFKILGAYWEEDYRTNDGLEKTYYAHIRQLKDYELTKDGNRYNIVIKFIFSPESKETQLTLEVPAKI